MTAINAQVSSRQKPVKQIQFATDGAGKPYISAIRVGRTWQCKPWQLFSLRVRNGATTNNIDQTSFSVTGPTMAPDGTITLVANGQNTYAGIQVTLTITERDRGFAFTASVYNAVTSTWGIDSLCWPCIELYPYGEPEDCYAVFGDWGGCVVWKPQEYGSIFPRMCGSPIGMYNPLPLAAVFDGESKGVIAMRSEDTDRNAKVFTLMANTTSTRFDVRQHFTARYVSGVTAGAAQTKNVTTVYLEGFDSTAPNAVDVYYDVFEWYKQWATAQDRPWMQKGPWRSRSDVSPVVKNASVIYYPAIPSRNGADFVNVVSDITNLVNYLGVSESKGEFINHLYSWPYTEFNSRNPDVFWDNSASNSPGTLNTTLTSYVRDGMTAIQTLPFTSCMIYTFTNIWDTSNVTSATPALNYTGAFNFDAYDTFVPGLGAVDIADYSLKDYQGNTKTRTQDAVPPTIPYANTHALMDYANGGTPLIEVSIMYRYLICWNGDGPGERPIGFYWDTAPVPWGLGSEVLGLNGDVWNDDPTKPTWSIGQYLTGVERTIEVFKALAHDAVGVDEGIPTIYTSCEAACQDLIGTYDLQHVGEFELTGLTYGNQLSGGNVHGYQYVFGEYVRIGHIVPAMIYSATGTVASRLCAGGIPMVGWHWLVSGTLAVSNAVTTGTLIDAPNAIDGTSNPPAHPNDPYWLWFKTLYDTVPYTRKFMQGTRLPSPGGSANEWQRGFIRQSAQTWRTFLRTSFGNYKTMACTRRAADGVIGVIILNAVRSNLDYSYGVRPTEFTATVTVDLYSTFHRLPAGLKTVYVRNLSTGVRTALTTFRDSVSLTRTLAPFSVELLEVEVTGA